MKGKYYVFCSHKQKNKVFFVYLECKLQQDSYGWCILKLTIAFLNFQQLSIIQCVYLAFENLKRSTKIGQQYLES